MKIRNIIIVLSISLLSLASICERGVRTYELKGTVKMINDCTGNVVDLPAQIRMKATLSYSDTTDVDDYNKANIPAAAAGPATREAEYSFKSTTSHIAKEWNVTEIVRNATTEICKPIICHGTPQPECQNRSANAFVVPVPSGQRVMTKNFNFGCTCVNP